ncbi:MAG: COP23 domain-containing protein [Nostoc sp.]
MKKTTGTRLFTSVLAIASFLTVTSEQVFSQTQRSGNTEKTTFHCIRNGSGFATVARRGNAQTGAMITWNDTSFGSKFTPKDRCAIVARRFNKALSTTGNNSLGFLKLTYGELNRNPVICYIRTKEEEKQPCNEKNLILTLNKSEFGQERAIIEQLKNFSVNGTGTAFVRGPGEGKTIIAEFGKQIYDAFKSGATQKATPELDVTDSESTPESTTSQPVSTPKIQP